MHEWLVIVNARKILNRDFHSSIIDFYGLFKSLAEGACLAKWVAEFVLREAFADIAGSGRAENFGEALFFDVAERNLSAMVEAASDYSTVMKNRNVSV